MTQEREAMAAEDRSPTDRNEPGATYARNESAEPFCSPKAAAEHLNVTPQAFDALRKRYGIGRYHLPRAHDQIVYSLNDLDRVRVSLSVS